MTIKCHGFKSPVILMAFYRIILMNIINTVFIVAVLGNTIYNKIGIKQFSAISTNFCNL